MENLILAVFVLLIPAFLWIWFYIVSDKRKMLASQKMSILSLALFLGIIVGVFAVLIENSLRNFVFSILDRISAVFSTSQEEISANFQIFILLFSAFILAAFELILHYFILKRYIFKNQAFKKVITGVRAAIFFGFGFVLIKIGFEFLFSDHPVITITFISEKIFLVFIYLFYSSLLGYFIALSKLHKLYEEHFLRIGFLIVFLLYGFSFLTLKKPLFNYAFWIFFIIFWLLIKYLIERRNFEENLIERDELKPPLFHTRREIITYLYNEKLSLAEMKKLSFCPKCFVIKRTGWKACPYCGLKL